MGGGLGKYVEMDLEVPRYTKDSHVDWKGRGALMTRKLKVNVVYMDTARPGSVALVVVEPAAADGVECKRIPRRRESLAGQQTRQHLVSMESQIQSSFEIGVLRRTANNSPNVRFTSLITFTIRTDSTIRGDRLAS